MQAPTTLTRGKGINPLTAGAIALALLATATIGLATLGNEIGLPLIGSDSKVESFTAADPQAEMLLIEQNSFDYATGESIDALFLEENSWDYQPVADFASVESILFIEENVYDYQQPISGVSVEGFVFNEDNSFDYVIPAAVDYARFIEDNSWDWAERAHLAGEESAPAAAPDHRFMEENSWDTDHLVYPEESGSSDY